MKLSVVEILLMIPGAIATIFALPIVIIVYTPIFIVTIIAGLIYRLILKLVPQKS